MNRNLVKFHRISTTFLAGTAGRGRALESNGDLENRLGKLEELSRHTGHPKGIARNTFEITYDDMISFVFQPPELVLN